MRFFDHGAVRTHSLSNTKAPQDDEKVDWCERKNQTEHYGLNRNVWEAPKTCVRYIKQSALHPKAESYEVDSNEESLLAAPCLDPL